MIAGPHKANNGLDDLNVSTVLDSLICLECNAYGNWLIAMKKSVKTKFDSNMMRSNSFLSFLAAKNIMVS